MEQKKQKKRFISPTVGLLPMNGDQILAGSDQFKATTESVEEVTTPLDAKSSAGHFSAEPAPLEF